jgi:MFS family permease
MLIAGRVFDRFGPRTGGISLLLLSVAGLAVSTIASGFVSLVILMLLAGAASGASDVAINAAAANTERAASKPVLTRAHAFFSLAVVVSSLAAGALNAAGVPAFGIFVVVAGVAVISNLMPISPPDAIAAAPNGTRVHKQKLVAQKLPFIVLMALSADGLLGAMALAVENAHQSWAAVFLNDTLEASPMVSALGPASFAAVAAAIRFGAGAVKHTVRPIIVLCLGGLAAAAGTLLLATSTTVSLAILGVVLAAAGTAVCFPTLLGIVAAHTAKQVRGRVVSAVSSVAYLGFLFGPVVVGGFSAGFGLRVGLGAIAGLAAVFTVLVIPLVGWATGVLRKAAIEVDLR